MAHRHDDPINADEMGEGDGRPGPQVVHIWRKMPVGSVHIGDGDIPFEAAVLMELGQALANVPAKGESPNVFRSEDGTMHDKYEASFQGRSVVVKLGDVATEDM